jgi:hypothetical protein
VVGLPVNCFALRQQPDSEFGCAVRSIRGAGREEFKGFKEFELCGTPFKEIRCRRRRK